MTLLLILLCLGQWTRTVMIDLPWSAWPAEIVLHETSLRIDAGRFPARAAFVVENRGGDDAIVWLDVPPAWSDIVRSEQRWWIVGENTPATAIVVEFHGRGLPAGEYPASVTLRWEPCPPADVDHDCRVSLSDYQKWIAWWYQVSPVMFLRRFSEMQNAFDDLPTPMAPFRHMLRPQR